MPYCFRNRYLCDRIGMVQSFSVPYRDFRIMRQIDNRRIRTAWLLMLVYLPMMLAITFHHHSEAEGNAATAYCYDCAHHIHHDGHLTAGQGVTHECVLCQLHSLVYVAPAVVRIAVLVAVAHTAFCMACPFVKKREGAVLSTRAPPAM